MAATPFFLREQVAEHFHVSPGLLARYEAHGLVKVRLEESGAVVYEPAEVRRVWTIVSLHRDLGVNLAGIEAILRLKEHVEQLQASVAVLASALNETPEDPADEESSPAP